MSRLILAIQFLTLFSFKKDMEVTREELSASMAYFPLVGALQGLILAFSYKVLSGSGLLQDSVATALVLLILVLTNGGLHLDGFIDTVDGIAGGKTPQDRLRIMKDSHIGAIGVVFVVLVLLVKYSALLEIPEEAKAQAIFMFPVIGRWAMVPMACWAPYARPEGGLGASFASNGGSTLIKATIMTAVLLALSLGALALVLLAVIGLMVFLFTRFFKKRLGGVTGDVFGFQSEVAEVVFLVAALAMMNILSMYAD